ncbi:hypothetical protein [Ensifer sp. NM-2]|uniref:hypothetical protein n=1 Tax=Ensifer sp. NM-2 TaxID=2109730 RepID=UPI0018EAF850
MIEPVESALLEHATYTSWSLIFNCRDTTFLNRDRGRVRQDQLGRTNTTKNDDDEHVILIRRPATALKRWIDEAGLNDGRWSDALKRPPQWRRNANV